MRVTLVGADSEENLGIGMIAASLVRTGHRVSVVPFDDGRAMPAVASQVRRTRPHLVGLGIQFQHRAPDFFALANQLRAGGFRGHITAGGQHATHAYDVILGGEPAIDSIIRFEGEQTIVELAAALEQNAQLHDVAGLVFRSPLGPRRTAPRPLAPCLDDLPKAHRYRPHTRHYGFPFIPVVGSRGCWGSCAFCSITSYYRASREEHGGGRLLRLRSVANLAQEMATLHHAAGSDTSLFCFHDDSFLLPRAADSIARLRALRRELTRRGVRSYGLAGKCRPDTITDELAEQLRALGVFRMFVGVENASQAGQDHLDRRTRTADLERALGAFRAAGIFATYNLLLFEPDATLDDIRQNAAFLRRFAGIPGNFCRAEPFHGTPLHHRLAERGALLGDYRGWDYRIADDRVELLFRLTLAAFRERNYDCHGVGNRHVGLAYLAQLVRTFLDADSPRAQRALRQAHGTVSAISIDSAVHLEAAVDLAEQLDPGDHRGAEDAAVELALRVMAQDRRWQRELDDSMNELESVADAARSSRAPSPRVKRGQELAQRVALASTLLATAACGGQSTDDGAGGSVNEGGTGGSVVGGGTGGLGGTGGQIESDGGFPPVIGGSAGTGGLMGDGGAPPVTGGTGGLMGDGGAPPVAGGTGGTGGYPLGGWVSDTGGSPPVGGASDGGFPPVIGGAGGTGPVGPGGEPPLDAGGAAGWTVDYGGAPPLGGVADHGGAAGWTVDYGGAPVRGGTTGAPQGGISEAGGKPGAPRSCGGDAGAPHHVAARSDIVDHWRDTTPRRPTRDPSLPLFDPPAIALEGSAQDQGIRVVVRGATPAMELYWDGPGAREEDGHRLYWRPTSRGDRLTLVVRHPGGVASASLLAGEVKPA